MKDMTNFDYNARYMLKNNKPWFPIMGEIHYSRYPEAYWKESIYKMKAGGIEVVSSYVLWIHHEEIEGEYDFTGQRNLRKFVETCKECDAYMMLRVGPWCHAEVRNGGMPDWLIQKPFNERTNDPAYLVEVEKYYTKIFEQVEGLLHKDGGPIIGLQIENEYGHCGGLTGEEGEEHMRILTEMAKRIGFEVPIYTATGWGGAVTGGLLPVMGGYCEAPWDQRLTEIEPSGNYILTHERNDHNIGSDYGFGEGITFDISKFPYLTAELGGGLQVTHHRRPIAKSKDIGAMSMVKLGSGVNLLGYYMYHGGTNPEGKRTTLQESRATGYLNDLPELNYDFRAPIREYGQVSNTLREIKMLTMFTKDFGEALCEMPAVIPEGNPLQPTNFKDLRYSYRHNGKSGYVFVNNYQRGYKMADHEAVSLKVEIEDEMLVFPTCKVKDGDFFFYPFNMPVGEAVLKTALATPLCTLGRENIDTYVFYTDDEPCYQVEGDLKQIKLLTLTREEAKNAWKVQKEREHIVIATGSVVATDNGIVVTSRERELLKVYPAFAEVPVGYERLADQNEFAVYMEKEADIATDVTWSLLEETVTTKRYELHMNYDGNMKDTFLRINYGGDTAKLYLDGKLVADHFYTSETWEIGLKRFNFPEKLVVEIMALDEGTPIYLQKWPEMKDGKACEILDVSVECEHESWL